MILKICKHRQPAFNQVVVYGALALCATSCATTNNDVDNVPALSVPAYSSAGESQVSATDMGQIEMQTSSLNASQINRSAEVNQLTVEQLRAYADRCSPQANRPPPKDLDCSDLNLRVKRVFNSEDKVTEALITLDRLGRNDTIDNALDDLEDGRYKSSLNGQAIAGGLANPVPVIPDEPEENLEDYLNENGLAINAGAIITNPG